MASVKSLSVKRLGLPFGKFITYNLLSAVKASCLPSGDGFASLICVTRPSALSSIGYLKSSIGPKSRSTSTENGISLALLSLIRILYNLPPYEVIKFLLSGVNAIAGKTPNGAMDSCSSR